VSGLQEDKFAHVLHSPERHRRLTTSRFLLDERWRQHLPYIAL